MQYENVHWKVFRRRACNMPFLRVNTGDIYIG
jgi:hypothetical protein